MRLRFITLSAIFALSTVPMLGDGGQAYKAKCAICHGPDGSGQTPTGKTLNVRDLRSAEVQKQTDAELAKVVSTGKGKMPAYGKQLSDADVAALVAFIRTLK